MNPKLQALFDRYAASTLEKQLHLNELVGELDWRFAMDDGVLAFGEQIIFSFDAEHEWHAQILGTQSDESNTWLWSWANEASDIPPALTVFARRLKAFGEQHGIQELTEPQLALDEFDGHFLSILAAGECVAAAYYRGPYEDGAAFFLIDDADFPRRDDDPASRILSVFPQSISAYPIANHRAAFQGYLQFHNLGASENGRVMVVELADHPALTAEFDELDRLVQLHGKLG